MLGTRLIKKGSNMMYKKPTASTGESTSRHPPHTDTRGEYFSAQTISLGKNMSLTITPIEIAFTLPHRYHERVLHELRENFPRPQILLSRRVGYLGSHQPVRYSLLAYAHNDRDREIKVSGAALTSNEAWTYNALIPLKDLGIGIAKVLEHVAALPIHSAVPAKPARQRNHANVTDSFCDTG